MANWVTGCKNCSRTFVHSTIEDTLVNYSDTLANYYFPQRPVFGESGDILECPHCHAELLYQAFDLKYKA